MVRLGVFAPSSPFSDERFQRGVDRLRSFGADVVLHPQLSAKKGYLAGTDEERVGAFHDLLRDPSIDAVIAARGGYGAHRLLDRLDFDLLKKTHKPLIGFSDICAIQSAILKRLGVEHATMIHGPVVTQIGELPEDDARSFLRLLTADRPAVTLDAQRTSLAPGRAEGPLIGGCLSVIAPLIGSDHLYLPEGAILLLEDVSEAPYRIDRLLTHLRLAGVLKRVAGIALGEWIACDPPRANEQTIDEVLADRLGDLGVPVLYALPVGHGKRNSALPIGAIAAIDAEARTLTIR